MKKAFTLVIMMTLLCLGKANASITIVGNTVTFDNAVQSDFGQFDPQGQNDSDRGYTEFQRLVASCTTVVISGNLADNMWTNSIVNIVKTSATTYDFSGWNNNNFNQQVYQLSGLTNAQTITFPDNLTELKYGICADMVNLTTVNLPTTLQKINQQAFKGCNQLTTINLNDLTALKTIDEAAFLDCYNLFLDQDFHVPNSVETINKQAFKNTGIKNLYFDADSNISYIGFESFSQEGRPKPEGSPNDVHLSNVYVNVSPAREIFCEKQAFDMTETYGHSDVGTVTTRLHYPEELYSYYVGDYKATIYDQNYDLGWDSDPQVWVLDENNQRIHSYGLITQSTVQDMFSGASNGWQEFISSGIPFGEQALYRTYSDEVDYFVPGIATLQVYLVYDYNKDENLAYCVQMQPGQEIPKNTGLIVHSKMKGVVYMPRNTQPTISNPFDEELYHNDADRYLLEGTRYKNYLKPINGSLYIDNVEIVDGEKTYRNFFFNSGTTASYRPGADWTGEYVAKGWGFFRAQHGNYTVWNKAFLHLPASMTKIDTQAIDDHGELPQDQQGGSGSANSFGLCIINLNDGSITKAINVPNFSEIQNSEKIYNLQGVEVKNPTKGIYIKNNKKYIIR